MQPDDHGSNAAIARMNADVKHSRMRFAEPIHRIFVQNANHFVQTNVDRRPSECVTAFGSALRLHQAGLIQNPHQLPGVRDRQAFTLRNLIERQRLFVHFRARKLNETAQTVLFMS